MPTDDDFLSTLDESQLGSWHQFLDSLHALAAPADQQIARFPPFVEISLELAEDYDHWYQVTREFVKHPFTRMQLAALDTLQHAINDIDAAKDEDLWAPEALPRGPEWSRLRNLAATALATLDQSPRPPGPNGGFFVPAD